MHPQAQKGYIIHLQNETTKNRLPYINTLIDTLKPIELSIFNASDGSLFQKDPSIPKVQPVTRQRVSQGNMGCTHSHLLILEQDFDTMVIFEDDCELTAPKEAIQAFLDLNYQQPWDILLLGANEYVDAEIDVPGFTKRVKRFWGTQALIVRKKAARAVLATFKEMQKEGLFPPADWLYNEAIKRHNLVCIGPNLPTKFCRQARGLVSLITGKVR
jgi:GR25 family glycosyltransferase involved in LPS biosynthesis